MVGKRGWWIFAFVLFVPILSTIVLATCPPPPAVCYCPNGQKESWEACDASATPTGCNEGYHCNDACTACIADAPSCVCGDTTCSAACGETYASCPQDCECVKDCSGMTCGNDPVCGQSCGSCTLPAICCTSASACNLNNCCTPSTTCSANPNTIACNALGSGTYGCGVSCTVRGTNCSLSGLPSSYICIENIGCKESCTGSGTECRTAQLPRPQTRTCGGAYWSEWTDCPSGYDACTGNQCGYTPSVSAATSVTGTAPNQVVAIQGVMQPTPSAFTLHRAGPSGTVSLQPSCSDTAGRKVCSITDNGPPTGTYTYTFTATINGGQYYDSATALIGTCDECALGDYKCDGTGTRLIPCTTIGNCKKWSTSSSPCDSDATDCKIYTCPAGTSPATCSAVNKDNGATCGAGICQGGVCQAATITVNPTSLTLNATDVGSVSVTSSIPGTTYTKSGFGTSGAFTSPLAIPTTIAQISAAAYELTINGILNSVIIATQKVYITVTCSPGHACYCQAQMGQGCTSSGEGQPLNYYCPNSLSCKQCPSDNIYNPGLQKCTQCNSTNILRCTDTITDCQYRSCTTAGGCIVLNSPPGTVCNGIGRCNGDGTCSGCDDVTCEAKTHVESINKSNYLDECNNVTLVDNVLHSFTCNAAKTACNDQSSSLPQSNITTTLNAGTSCRTALGKNGECAFVQSKITCVPYNCETNADCADTSGCTIGTCDKTSTQHACTYIANPEACNDPRLVNKDAAKFACQDTVSICGGSITCQIEGVADHECTGVNISSGLCKGAETSHVCTAKCPSFISNDIPGCSPARGMYNMSGMIATPAACLGTELCYVCNPNHFYNPSDDKCYPSEYTFDFTYDTAVATEQTIIVPSLQDASGRTITNGDHVFQFRLAMEDRQLYTYDEFSFIMDAPGVYPVTITTLRNGAPVASKSKDLTVYCSPSACCERTATAFKAEGSSCQELVSGNYVSGVCHNNTCSLSCILQTSRETGKDDRGRDRCNNGIDDDCNGFFDCNDQLCKTQGYCKTACTAGLIVCGDSCVDTTTSNTHCGDCNRPCKPSEQCIQGSCTVVEECQIACNADRDCRTGEVCINPGDCKRSYCTPANTVVANQTQVESISQAISDSKAYRITKDIYGNKVRVRIYNLAPLPLQNVTVTVNLNFPKTVVRSASEISADRPYTVVQDDPIIAFVFPEVIASQEIIIELPETLDPALVDSVYVSATHNAITGQPAALTEEQLTITSNIISEGGKTKLVIGLDPHAKLSGVRVPIDIPKCMLESARGMNMSGDFEIIKDDPLVVWTFDSLNSKQNIEIDIGDKKVEADCKNALTAFAVAGGIHRPLNPWLPLLIIPIIGVIIIFFQRFRADDVEERLSKEEFENIARQEGKSDEQITEAWNEYQKKF